MVYFEQARLEFFGIPLMYMPFFSAPDPTVKRKTGFLMPVFSSSGKYGFAVEVPYFWALAPDYDLTLSPTITTRQGPLLQAEWRQRLINGSYYIRGAGIYQLDKDAFLRSDGTPTPGFRNFRGTIEFVGHVRARPDHYAHQPLDCRMGHRGADRQDLLPGLFPAQILRHRRRSAEELADRRYFTALCHRTRRPQFLRCALDLLLRVFRSRRADPAADHPSRHRLFRHLGPAPARRPTGVQLQLHESEPQRGIVRPDHANRGAERDLRTDLGRSGGQDSDQLSAARYPRHLHALLGRDQLEADLYRPDRPDVHTLLFAAGRRRRDQRAK